MKNLLDGKTTTSGGLLYAIVSFLWSMDWIGEKTATALAGLATAIIAWGLSRKGDKIIKATKGE